MSDRLTMLNDLKKLVSYDTFAILSKETAPLKDIQRLYEYKMLEMKLIEESEQKTSISRFNELTGLDIQTGSTTFLFTLSDIQKIIALIDRKDRIIEEM
jgi:DNA-binding LytR/AlgR family response regulator